MPAGSRRCGAAAILVAMGGYLIGRDDAVRLRSNADLGRFLADVLAERRG